MVYFVKLRIWILPWLLTSCHLYTLPYHRKDINSLFILSRLRWNYLRWKSPSCLVQRKQLETSTDTIWDTDCCSQMLPYEDVAKLNPFYEEYRSFWNMSPEMGDTTLPSDTSTNSSQSIGSGSESDQSLYYPEISSLSPVRNFQPISVGVPATERLRVAVHDGYEYTPTYNTHPEAMASQAAILEYDNPRKHPLSPVEEHINICKRESSELDHIDSSLGQARSSHKRLFGRNGWLGGTADLGNLSSEKHRSKSLKDLRKKIVDGFVGLFANQTTVFRVLMLD